MNIILATAVLISVSLSSGDVIDVPLERYLMGVVPAEMSSAEDMDALLAQAVFSRTYAICRLRWPRAENFHVFSRGRYDQAYVPSKRNSRTDAAVRWTHNIVLKGEDSNCKHAMYGREMQERIIALANEGFSWYEILDRLGKETTWQSIS